MGWVAGQLPELMTHDQIASETVAYRMTDTGHFAILNSPRRTACCSLLLDRRSERVVTLGARLLKHTALQGRAKAVTRR
jgi:hypothetical protein